MINEEVTMAIWQSVESEPDKWCAGKFIAALDEHKRRYPAFKEERVAEMFISAPLKYKMAYAYKPIKSFTKTIHRVNSWSSQAAGQS